jgi:hypothetical protein
MYVQRNFEALSYNHAYSGTSINITYSESIFVALGTQHSMGMRHIVICGLPGSTLVFYIIS